ncbi:hypothetical protein ACFQZZ_04405 [Nocardia sp. GCM10030253]
MTSAERTDGYEINPVTGMTDPNERVWKVIQNSSERLSAVLNH